MCRDCKPFFPGGRRLARLASDVHLVRSLFRCRRCAECERERGQTAMEIPSGTSGVSIVLRAGRRTFTIWQEDAARKGAVGCPAGIPPGRLETAPISGARTVDRIPAGRAHEDVHRAGLVLVLSNAGWRTTRSRPALDVRRSANAESVVQALPACRTKRGVARSVRELAKWQINLDLVRDLGDHVHGAE